MSLGEESIPQLLMLNSEMKVHSTTFDPELRNEGFTLISFMGFSVILSAFQPFQIYIFNRKGSKLTFSNGSQLMGKRFMANLYTSLDSKSKSKISKISYVLGVHSHVHFPLDVRSLGVHSMEWAHSQDLTLFLLCHRSFLMKDQ